MGDTMVVRLRRSLVLVGVATLFTLTLAPGTGFAKVDKALVEELTPVVTEATKSQDLAAKQVSLITWGLWADKKQAKELEAYKTDDDPGVRLGAGLALYVSGQRKSEEFVIQELSESGDLYMALKDRVALIEDGKETKLLEKLVKKPKKPEIVRDTTRYLSEQNGDLFELLVKWAKDKKGSDLRQASLTALVAAARLDSLSVAGDLITHKDKDVQMAGVSLANRIAQSNATSRPAAAAVLQKGVASKDDTVRLAATRALLGFNDRSAAAAALEIAATTEDAMLRKELLTSTLAGIDRGLKPTMAQIKPLLEKEKELPADEKVIVYKLAGSTNDGAIKETLLKFYASNDYDERLLATQALPYTDDSGVIGLLERSLFEGNPMMRLYAAQGLQRKANKQSMNALQKALNREKNRDIKLAVIGALGNVDDPRALQVLRFQVTSTDPAIKKAVVAAVRAQGKKDGYKVLEQLLRDRDKEVRWSAFVAAMHIAPKQGKAFMSGALREPPASFAVDIETLPEAARKTIVEAAARSTLTSVRPLGLGYIKSHRAEYSELIRTLVAEESYNVGARRSLLDTLAAHPSKQDLTTIERLASKERDLNVRKQAARILVAHATSDMLATFRGMLSAPDAELRALAALGLAKSSS